MDILMTIRSIIFLTAGLLMLVFPKQVVENQSKVMQFLIKKLHLKYQYSNTDSDKKHRVKVSVISGIGFLIISLILFIIAIR